MQFVEAAIVPMARASTMAWLPWPAGGKAWASALIVHCSASEPMGNEGNLGHQGAGGRMPVKRRSAGPQLKSPVPFGRLGGGVDQQLGVEADLISVEAVRVVEPIRTSPVRRPGVARRSFVKPDELKLKRRENCHGMIWKRCFPLCLRCLL